MENVRFRCQRELNAEPRSHAVLAFERTAQRLDAFAHATQTVAFDGATAPSIILNVEPATSIYRHQPQMTIAGLGMAHHVGHGFPHHERHHALLRWGQVNRFGLRFDAYTRGFERSRGLLEFR